MRDCRKPTQMRLESEARRDRGSGVRVSKGIRNPWNFMPAGRYRIGGFLVSYKRMLVALRICCRIKYLGRVSGAGARADLVAATPIARTTVLCYVLLL